MERKKDWNYVECYEKGNLNYSDILFGGGGGGGTDEGGMQNTPLSHNCSNPMCLLYVKQIQSHCTVLFVNALCEWNITKTNSCVHLNVTG